MGTRRASPRGAFNGSPSLNIRVSRAARGGGARLLPRPARAFWPLAAAVAAPGPAPARFRPMWRRCEARRGCWGCSRYRQSPLPHPQTRQGGSEQRPVPSRPHGPCPDPRWRPEGSARAVPGPKMADAASAPPPSRPHQNPPPQKINLKNRSGGREEKTAAAFIYRPLGRGLLLHSARGGGGPEPPPNGHQTPPGGAEGLEMRGGHTQSPPSCSVTT